MKRIKPSLVPTALSRLERPSDTRAKLTHPRRISGHALTGDKIVTWDESGEFRLWSREGALLREGFRPHAGGPDGFAAGAGALVSWGAGKLDGRPTIAIWSPDSSGVDLALTGHDKPIEAVEFEPNGDLISWDEDGALILWQRSFGYEPTPLARIASEWTSEARGGVLRIGKGRLLAWGRSPELSVLEFPEGARLAEPAVSVQRLPLHERCIYSVQAVRPGLYASHGHDNALVLLSFDRPEQSRVLHAHSAVIGKVRILSPNAIMSVDLEGTLVFWHEDEGGEWHWTSHHRVAAGGVATSPSSLVAAWSEQGELAWFAPDGQRFGGIDAPDILIGARWLDGEDLLLWGSQPVVERWSTRYRERVGVADLIQRPVLECLPLGGDTILATGFEGMEIAALRRTRAGRTASFPDTPSRAIELCDGTVLTFCALSDFTMQRWSLEGERIGEPLLGHRSPVDRAWQLPGRALLSWARRWRGIGSELLLWPWTGQTYGSPMRIDGRDDSLTDIYDLLLLGDGGFVTLDDDRNVRRYSRCGERLTDLEVPDIRYKGRLLPLADGGFAVLYEAGQLVEFTASGQESRRILPHPLREVEGVRRIAPGRHMCWARSNELSAVQFWSDDLRRLDAVHDVRMWLDVIAPLPEGKYMASGMSGGDYRTVLLNSDFREVFSISSVQRVERHSVRATRCGGQVVVLDSAAHRFDADGQRIAVKPLPVRPILLAGDTVVCATSRHLQFLKLSGWGIDTPDSASAQSN